MIVDIIQEKHVQRTLIPIALLTTALKMAIVVMNMKVKRLTSLILFTNHSLTCLGRRGMKTHIKKKHSDG